MNILILLAGLHSLFFAVFHCLFWKALDWKKQLARLSPTNNAVMQILNLRLTFLFFAHAFVCFWFQDDLLQPGLGQAFWVVSALFWLGRTVEEVVFRRLMPERNALVYVLWVLFVGGTVLEALPLWVD